MRIWSIFVAVIVLHLRMLLAYNGKKNQFVFSGNNVTAQHDNEVELFKADKMHASVIYNIGDLLNMPTYMKHWSFWIKNHTSPRYLHARETAAKLNNTILNYYFSMYKNVSLHDRYPIIANLLKAVKQYGQHNKVHNSFPTHFAEVQKNSTLLVHIRAGDRGSVAESHIAQLLKLSYNFTNVIVMGGTHNSRPDKLHEVHEAAHKTSFEIHKIVNRINNVSNLGVLNLTQSPGKCEIHYGTNPDDDIYLMSVAANLMLHRGGYTAIGGLVCQGIVYFARELNYYYDNPEYMREIKNPVILH